MQTLNIQTNFSQVDVSPIALAESTRARTRDFCRDDVNDDDDERERLRLAFFSSSILEYFPRKACPTGHRAYREGRTSFGVWEFGVV